MPGACGRYFVGVGERCGTGADGGWWQCGDWHVLASLAIVPHCPWRMLAWCMARSPVYGPSAGGNCKCDTPLGIHGTCLCVCRFLVGTANAGGAWWCGCDERWLSYCALASRGLPSAMAARLRDSTVNTLCVRPASDSLVPLGTPAVPVNMPCSTSALVKVVQAAMFSADEVREQGGCCGGCRPASARTALNAELCPRCLPCWAASRARHCNLCTLSFRTRALVDDTMDACTASLQGGTNAGHFGSI